MPLEPDSFPNANPDSSAAPRQQALPDPNLEASPRAVREAAQKTDDFALLNPGKPAGMQEHFTESDTWRVLRIQSEFVHAFEVMSKVGPAVSAPPSPCSARRV